MTKAEVTVPSLDDWEKEWERAENVEGGKLKCATKVAAGGFPVAVGCQPPVAEQCFPGVMIDCEGAQSFA